MLEIFESSRPRAQCPPKRAPLPGLLIPSDVHPQGVQTSESTPVPPVPYNFTTAAGTSPFESPGPEFVDPRRVLGPVLNSSELIENPRL